MTESTGFHCNVFDRVLTDYLEGRSSAKDVHNVELHASHCARCEQLLDRATRQATAFAPPLPPEMRESVVRAISDTPVLTIVRDADARSATQNAQSQRPQPFRRLVLPILAAAAVIAVVMVSARSESETPLVASTPPTDASSTLADSPSLTAPTLDQNIGFVYTAARVANTQAQAEFEELDAATEELERAIAQTPNDRELRAFLSSVRARREELARRVREATS